MIRVAPQTAHTHSLADRYYPGNPTRKRGRCPFDTRSRSGFSLNNRNSQPRDNLQLGIPQ